MNILNQILLFFEGEDINEHIANSKIPGDCPNAFSKSREVCEDGIQVRNLCFIWQHILAISPLVSV